MNKHNRPNQYHLIRWSMLLLGGLMLMAMIVQPLASVYGADILMPTVEPTPMSQLPLTPQHLHSATDYLGYGNQAVELGDYQAAINYYNQSIERYPYSWIPYNNRGLVYATLGDYEASLADLNHALQFTSDFPYPYNNRGFTLINLGEIEAGLADINHSLKIDDTNPLAYHNRGLAYFMLGQPDRAIADYMQAITLGKDNSPLGYDEAESYRGLGDAYDAQGKTIPALRHYLTYVELAGDAADLTVLERITEIEGN